jgi:HTH-type transcriptional repressor of NAD biosynthesis genes
MSRGLVIGKFLPLHQGHIALINFAAVRCDELIVSMSVASDDPIDPVLRLSWLQQVFQNNENIRIFSIEDNFDDTSLPLQERTKIWADFIKRTYPHIDYIFSSEHYGDTFAENLKAKHVSFDPDRRAIPISASRIRQAPFQYWEFIPEVVRPFFVKKFCFYGPESTGKSVMCNLLASRFDTTCVPEVARELITTNDFSLEDIIRIGEAHYNRIIEKAKIANKILFCDTDAITTQIYSQHYLHEVPQVLFELENKMHYDHYFLFDIDVPWVSDGLRDLGEQRQEMFNIFKSALDDRKINYTLVRGSYAQRQQQIETWLSVHTGLKANVI